jgi:hypothetical protein
LCTDSIFSKEVGLQVKMEKDAEWAWVVDMDVADIKSYELKIENAVDNGQ